jgi:hypothetical protein
LRPPPITTGDDVLPLAVGNAPLSPSLSLPLPGADVPVAFLEHTPQDGMG